MSAKDRVPRETAGSTRELAVQALVTFIKDAVETTHSEGVVVGLSGGVDSALSAALAVGALGPERVHAFMLPHRTSSPDSVTDARAVADGSRSRRPTASTSRPWSTPTSTSTSPTRIKVRLGNKMARERMSILFDQAKKLRSLVLGTSNKTEILLGYSTIFGDNASSINPLGDLYKQQVWQLATYLDLPARIVDKKPSADLWPGQTDEDELGFDYPTADEVLYLMFNFGLSDEEVIALDYPEDGGAPDRHASKRTTASNAD